MREDRIIRINKSITDYDYGFSHKCYYCGENVGCNVIYAQKIKPYSEDVRIKHSENYVFLGICPICSFPAVAIARKSQDDSKIFVIDYRFPQTPSIDTPPYLPDKIRSLYDELKAVYLTRKAPTMVVAAGRILLEAMLKTKTNENMSLLNLIQKLAKECVIPESLYEVASSVRVIGNKSIHEAEGITQEDAQDIFEFINIFIEYLFVLPEKVKRIKERHA